MLAIFKTLLDNVATTSEHAPVEQPPQLPPKKLLLKSVRVVLQRDYICQSEIDAHLDRARVALDAMPLATVDYAQAAACLENSHSYFRDGVSGAARYELRVLYRKLRNLPN